VFSGRLSFKANAHDHILPKSKYKNLYTEEETRYYQGNEWLRHTGREYSNLALSCTRCNTQKSSWDPNGEGPLVPLDVEDISLEQRAVLIERVRQYLRPRWARDEAELEIARRWAATFEPM
jgi:5-methylcytosine-specific restriction endonuclease McrA